jgi:hypothetical protein
MLTLNRIELTGNLTDKPDTLTVGTRQFVRARLAQSWDYESQGATITQRQFLQLVFVGDAANVAKQFSKGDQIYASGMLVRRAVRPSSSANNGESPGSDRGTTYEIHVTATFRSTQPDTGALALPDHQSAIRKAGNPHQFPFVKESLHDWPNP